MEAAAPKSIRPFPTLLVAILLAVALGASLSYPARWKWQRHEFLRRPNCGGIVSGLLSSGLVERPAPWALRLLGEQGYGEVYAPDFYLDEARRLFPEASWFSGPEKYLIITERW